MTKMDAGLGTCIDKSGVNVATLLKEREVSGLFFVFVYGM